MHALTAGVLRQKHHHLPLPPPPPPLSSSSSSSSLSRPLPVHEAFGGLRRHIYAEMKHISKASECLCSATTDPEDWREQVLKVQPVDSPSILPNLPARKKKREKAASTDAALSIVEFAQIILSLPPVQHSTTKRQRDALMRQASERGMHQQLPNLHDIEVSIADLHARSVFLEGAALLRARNNYLYTKLKSEISVENDSISTIHQNGDDIKNEGDGSDTAGEKGTVGAGQRNSFSSGRLYPFVFELFDGPLYHYLCSTNSIRE
mmetsp:Transcript_10721/g.14842  ORF Transcript_10721/g.14842 Transcript_10721/m.14842 type:complete len:263 (-) Transcript_10721:125-913(-)